MPLSPDREPWAEGGAEPRSPDDLPYSHAARGLVGWLLVRRLRARWATNLVTVVAIALGVGLALAVPLGLQAFERSAIDAADRFDLIVTAEGGRTQAVMSTIYHRDAPTGNVPYEVYASLAGDERTQRAVPIALGDSYSGFAVVGTTTEYFDLRAGPTVPPYLTLAQGSLFEHDFEAVLGSQVAAATGLALGQTFRASHGLVAGLDEEVHVHDYTVVGVLAPSGGPADRALYVTIGSVWESHGDHTDAEFLGADEACTVLESGQATSASIGNRAALIGVDRRYDVALTGTGGVFERTVTLYLTDEEPLLLVFDEPVTMTARGADGAALEVEHVGAEFIEGCAPAQSAVRFEPPAGPVHLTMSTDVGALRMAVTHDEHEEHAHEDDHEGDHADDHAAAWVPVEELRLGGAAGGGSGREVTAVLFMAQQLGQLYQMSRFIDELPGVQAVFPGQVLGEMLDVVGDGRQAYAWLARVVLVLAVLTVAINTYSAAVAAQRDLAVVRAVGVSGPVVAVSVLGEALLLGVVGIVVGVAAAYAATMAFGAWTAATAGLSFSVPGLRWADLAPALWLLPAAVLMASLPALQAARRSPLERL